MSNAMLFVSLLVLAVSVAGQQDIYTPFAKGPAVVEAVCNLIDASCVFDDDKLFTRRLAYVESSDGLDSKTFREGYYGGIWQLDQSQFDVTQSSQALSYLSSTIAAVRTAFGIDWPTTRWSNLTIPMYSAVGARLYLQYQSRNDPAGIPRATDAQAQYWVRYYRPSGDVNYYIEAVNRLTSDCIYAGADMVFVLDSSGSIGSANFAKVKQFVHDVISAFDIGFDKTRVGVIQYSTAVQNIFDLNKYNNKADMLTAVANIPYLTGGTQTDAALNYMTTVSFTEARGARPIREGHPRIGIVLTDGQSNSPPLTVAAAERMHDADIIAFAIGVGLSVNMAELTAIASTPTCIYLIQLESGFNELDSLVYVIEKMACEAPIIMPPEGSERINSTLPVGGSQNCQIKVSASGTTVKLAVGSGATEDDTISFYTSEVTYPSESFYDQKAEATLNRQAAVYVTPPASGDSIYCSYKSDGQAPTNISIGTFPGDQNWCQSQPCQNNGECADQTNDFVCLCANGFLGTLCEVIDECYSQPCLNGATCTLITKGVSCSCVSGYVGTFCQGDPCSPDTQPLELSGFSGSFTTVNYPGNYANQADCQWLITALEENGIVSLNFLTFQTEACCDFVYVYDGDSTKSQLVQTLSGVYSQPPPRITSTGRNLFIRFTSDKTDSDIGFEAAYTTSASGAACTSQSQPLRLTTYAGLFVSLNYPFSYDANIDCRWLITSPESYGIINLIFNEFDTESCCDVVYIYNGDTPKSPLIVALSGTDTVSGGYNSTQRHMFVRFITDSTVSSVGFRASFSTLRPGNPCSSDIPLDLAEYDGTFTTTNYPANYSDNSDCQWRLSAIEGSGIVVLTFTEFSTEACCDFVKIYDGDSTKSVLIASLSGSIPTGTQYNSTQRYMFITFLSDQDTSSRGFSANYKSTTQGNPCSSLEQPINLSGYVGTFTSVNYPNDYVLDGNCQWRITAVSVDMVVMLDFEEFLTESCCDFVTLFDGDNAKASMLHTFSGILSPPPKGITSTQQFMFVKFTTDNSNNFRGFSAYFSSVSKVRQQVPAIS